MSDRFGSKSPYVRTTVVGLIAVAAVLSTGCRWLFPGECGGSSLDYRPPEGVPESVLGHPGPVWGRVGGADVIVFGWDEGRRDGGSLYMIRGDGTGLTLLSPTVGDGRELGCFDTLHDNGTGDYRIAFDTSPAISPDGSTVAYHTVRQSVFEGTPDIVAVTLDTGEFRRVTPVRGPDQHKRHTEPAWSPDGTRIAFVADSSLSTMAVDGSDVRGIAPGIESAVEPPAWSPDGTRIAFRGRPSWREPWSLYLVGADGSDLRLAADGEPDTDVEYEYWVMGVGTPVWSPDGQRIALLRTVVGSESPLALRVDAQVLDAATGAIRTVLKNAVGPLVWSPRRYGVAVLRAGTAAALRPRDLRSGGGWRPGDPPVRGLVAESDHRHVVVTRRGMARSANGPTLVRRSEPGGLVDSRRGRFGCLGVGACVLTGRGSQRTVRRTGGRRRGGAMRRWDVLVVVASLLALPGGRRSGVAG